MIKRIAGFYSIILGLTIIGLWIILLITKNVPELQTEPITIYFHLIAELLMGILAFISGIALIKKYEYGNYIFILANGLVIYSVINSSGYYGNKKEWSMVVMFMAILVISIFFTLAIMKESYYDRKSNNKKLHKTK